MNTQAYINRNIVEWAIAKNSLTMDAVADHINVKPNTIEDWIRGNKLPTFKQIHSLAEALLIPYGYLFLSSPPKETLPIPDLRTVGSIGVTDYSTEFQEVLFSTIRKQEWLREYLVESGYDELGFVGRFTKNDKPEVIAKDIANTLAIDEAFRMEVKGFDRYFTKLVRRCEDKGVVILRRGYVRDYTKRKLDIDEFRGFVLCDKYAPFIFINSNDYKAAQTFTLIHELAHIWINEEGVSNASVKADKKYPNDVEILCNAVAAKFLVPDDDLLDLWDRNKNLDENLKKIRLKFQVSHLVVLRRAYDLEIINKQEYDDKYIEWLNYYKTKEENKKKKNRERSGGGGGINVFLSQNSRLFTSHLVSATYEGKLLYRDAVDLCDKKNPSSINRAAEELGIGK